MTFFAWVLLVAIGLSAPSASLAQELAPPVTESDPLTIHQQENTSDAGEDTAHMESQVYPDVTPFLQGIEAAIRGISVGEDQTERKRQQDQDKRDLDAQESMALWAKQMFFATVASVFITFLGLVLIRRTLHHTRRAADYAAEMVVETRKTTDAANSAADEARRQANISDRGLALQHKPWLNVVLSGDFVENMTEFDAGAAEDRPARIRICAHIVVENLSQLPARITRFSIKADGFDEINSGEILFNLKGAQTARIDRVADRASISVRESSIPALLGSRANVDDNGWRAFQLNLPIIRVSINYTSTIGDTYEAGFSFKPTWLFGGE